MPKKTKTKVNTKARVRKKMLAPKTSSFTWLLILPLFAFVLILFMFQVFLARELATSEPLEKNEPVKTVIAGSNVALFEQEILALNEAQVAFDELSFLASPDGESFAYIITDSETSLRTVVLNGKAGASYSDITFMKFSPDGKRFAYGAKVSGSSLVVLDGQEGKLYDWILEPHFFSADSRYFVYKGRDERGDVLVFNTTESRAYERIYGAFNNEKENKLIFYGRQADAIWRGEINLYVGVNKD